MTKMINLFFALLLSLSIISCGGGGDGGGGNAGVNLPGTKGSTDATPNNPNSGAPQTGASSIGGCSVVKLPGCPA